MEVYKRVLLLTILLTGIVALILGLTVEPIYILFCLIIFIPGIFWTIWLLINPPKQDESTKDESTKDGFENKPHYFKDALNKLIQRFPHIPISKLKEILAREYDKLKLKLNKPNNPTT